jgi:hypothetical protein
MIGLLLGTALAQHYAPTVPPLPDFSQTTDARFCELTREHAARLPIAVVPAEDGITLSSLDLSCSDRTLVFVYASESGFSRFAETLRNENRRLCVDSWSPYRTMIGRGWRISAKWLSRGSESVSPPFVC